MKISLLGGWQSYHRYTNSLTPAAKIVYCWFIFIPHKHLKHPKRGWDKTQLNILNKSRRKPMYIKGLRLLFGIIVVIKAKKKTLSGNSTSTVSASKGLNQTNV